MYLTGRTGSTEEEKKKKMYLTETTERTERGQEEHSVGFIFFRNLKKIKPTIFSVSSVSSSESFERVRDPFFSVSPRGARGFSLVEVTLALMVVGVGMLAILGMFPAGLDQNTRSISDTHAALFAQEVFNSLRVHAETNWQEIGVGIYSLPAAASNNWHRDVDITIKLGNELENQIYTNIYCHPDNIQLVDHAFRYHIALATNNMIKSAFLRFWPGEFGQTSSPTVFYSEFFRMNR